MSIGSKVGGINEYREQSRKDTIVTKERYRNYVQRKGRVRCSGRVAGATEKSTWSYRGSPAGAS